MSGNPYKKSVNKLISEGYLVLMWSPEEMEGVSDEQKDHLSGILNEHASEFFSASADCNNEVDSEDETD